MSDYEVTVDVIAVGPRGATGPVGPREPLRGRTGFHPIYKAASPQPVTSVAFTNSTIASPRTWAFSSRTFSASPVSTTNPSWYTLTAGSALRVRNSGGSYYYSSNLGPSGQASGAEVGSTYDGSDPIRFEFIHDGELSFEFQYMNFSQRHRVWVDGELVTDGATTDSVGLANFVTGTDQAIAFRKFTFSTVQPRHIAIEVENPYIAGIVTGPLATVVPSPRRRPRVLAVGDSFLGGSAGCSVLDSWGTTLGRLLGWDVHCNGQGGSGFIAPGTAGQKYAARLPFFASIPFDAIVIAAGVNDTPSAAATIASETLAALNLARTQWPNAPIFVPFLHARGVDAYGASQSTWTQRDTVAAQCALVSNCYFIDTLEQPLGSLAFSTTLTAATIIGATTIATSQPLPIGTTVRIGTGATAERRVIRAVSGLNATVFALSAAHASGEAVDQVGMSRIVGTGRVGALAGFGDADRSLHSDTTHPTRYGSDAIATAIAAGIHRNI
jgi:hypothetical protein